MLRRHISAKSHHFTRGLLACFGFDNGCRQHGHHLCVVTVYHHTSVLAKDVRFGLCIGLHIAMPIQMVLGQVQHSRCSGCKCVYLIELET